jgi:hypothetical protein
VRAASTLPTSIPGTTPLPSAPPKGKTVLFLKCEEVSCGYEGDGLKAAGAAIGWNVKVLNFQAANPATLVSALQTGLQYHPVAAFLSGVPQEAWQSEQKPVRGGGRVHRRQLHRGRAQRRLRHGRPWLRVRERDPGHGPGRRADRQLRRPAGQLAAG